MALTTERVKIVKQLSILLDDVNLTYPPEIRAFQVRMLFYLFYSSRRC